MSKTITYVLGNEEKDMEAYYSSIINDLDKANLGIPDEIFREFSVKVTTEKIMQLVDSVESRLGGDLSEGKKYLSSKYVHHGIPYHSNIVIKDVLGIWNLSLRLNSNGFVSDTLPTLRKVSYRRHKIDGWIELPKHMNQFWPTLCQIHKKVTGYDPVVFYHQNEGRLDFISYKNVGNESIKFNITFERSEPDMDRCTWVNSH